MVQVRCPECGYLQTLSEERFITISEDFLNCPHCHARVPKQWIPDGGHPVPEEVRHKMLAFSRRILNGGDVGLEVVQALESLVRQHGQTDESIKALGIGYGNVGEMKKAEDFLLMARKEAPEDPAILQSLQEAFLAQKKYHEAAEVGRALLDLLGPRAADDDVARFALALMATDRKAEAKELLASFPDMDGRDPLVKQARKQVNRGKGGFGFFLAEDGPLARLLKRNTKIERRAAPTSPEQLPPRLNHGAEHGEPTAPMTQEMPELPRPSCVQPRELPAVMEYWIYAPEATIPSWEEVKESLSTLRVPEDTLARTVRFVESAVETDELVVEYIVRDDASELFHYPEELIPRNARDLSEADRDVLMNARTIVRLRLSHPTFPGAETLIFAGLLVEAVRSLTGGVVQDAVSHVLWGTEQWRDFLDDPGRHGVESHIQVEMLDEGGVLWIHTHGMGKFGLPDLEIEGVAADWASEGRELIAGIAHTLFSSMGPDFELKSPLSVGDTGVVASFAARPPDEEAHFPGGSLLLRVYLAGDDPADPAALARVLAAVRSPGEAPEPIEEPDASTDKEISPQDAEERSVDHLREQLLEAHRRARKDLSVFKGSFLRVGKSGGYIHAIKVGFPSHEGQFEWMWVTVEAWRGTAIVGRLENVPVLRRDLRRGSRVNVTEGQIFDWVISGEGRLVKGPYTEAILRPQ